jgi:hypothetical protein
LLSSISGEDGFTSQKRCGDNCVSGCIEAEVEVEVEVEAEAEVEVEVEVEGTCAWA